MKELTNYDCIKSMSVEEMAELYSRKRAKYDVGFERPKNTFSGNLEHFVVSRQEANAMFYKICDFEIMKPNPLDVESIKRWLF